MHQAQHHHIHQVLPIILAQRQTPIQVHLAVIQQQAHIQVHLAVTHLEQAALVERLQQYL